MMKVKLITVEEKIRALVFGKDSPFKRSLEKELRDWGCEVFQEPTGKFHYIFQLDSHSKSPFLLLHLEKEGKFLLMNFGQKISSDKEKNILSSGGRILEIVNFSPINSQFLAKKTLTEIVKPSGKKRIIFSSPGPFKSKVPKDKNLSAIAYGFRRWRAGNKKIILPALGLVIILFFGWFIFDNYRFFTRLKTEIGSQKISSVTLEKAEKRVSFWKKILLFSPLARKSINEGFLAIETGVSLLKEGKILENQVQVLREKILSGANTEEERQQILTSLDFIERKLALLSLYLRRATQIPFLTGLGVHSQKIEEAKKDIDFAKKTISLLSFFTSGEKKILFLFQNNMELRPTGGFIGSYGLMDLEKEKIKEFKVEDIYAADGQLKGHVEPPGPIRKYLGQPHWFFRDSNWNPDFAISARQAEWFLAKEMGISVDGVIAADLSFIQNLLKQTGEVFLTDYGENVASDNLFFKSQSYSQREFFPGSQAKKDFLGSLARTLLLKVEEEQPLALLKAARISLEEKHLLMYFHDSKLQEEIERLGWGGRLVKTNQLSDYLLINEANLGVNKGNYFIKRQIEKDIYFKEDGLKTEIKIILTNGAPSDNFLAGNYRVFMRIYLPAFFQAEQVFLDKKEIEFADDLEVDKRIIGLFLEVPPQQKREVSLLAEAQGDFSFYRLFIQKQPGTGEDFLTVRFKPLPSWAVENKNFESKDLNFQEIFLKDRLLEIKFKK